MWSFAAPGPPPALRVDFNAIQEMLDVHAEALGPDRLAYQNHAFRVANFCAALTVPEPGRDALDKIAIASALHDIGIWTAGTLDYLDPSVEVAGAHLEGVGRPEWFPEIRAMISEHHRIRAWRGDPSWLTEPFRRADWVDVTFGVRRFGLPRKFIRAVYDRWPDAGFHWKLVKLTATRIREHPLSPIPVLKW